MNPYQADGVDRIEIAATELEPILELMEQFDETLREMYFNQIPERVLGQCGLFIKMISMVYAEIVKGIDEASVHKKED